MASVEDRIAALEKQIKAMQPQLTFANNVANALQGRPGDATLSLPHNDSWLFADNVDATHPLNLRYVIASNVQKIVSSRLSFHLAAYRTYSNFSVTATGTESASHDHQHSHGSHNHNTFTPGGSQGVPQDTAYVDYGSNNIAIRVSGGVTPTYVSQGTTPSLDATGERQTHTHTVSGSSFLGVSEGASAAAVLISFDGIDQTVALGGPFSADVIELNVRQFFPVSQGAYHTVALQPSGLGRIEAHLRLGYYASAGQLV